MDWSTCVEFTYRAYAREHRNVEDAYKDVLTKVKENAELDKYAYKETLEVDDCILIRNEDVDRFMREGKLILKEGGPKLLIREWRILLEALEDSIPPKILIDRILSVCGNIFTNIKVTESLFTDCQSQ